MRWYLAAALTLLALLVAGCGGEQGSVSAGNLQPDERAAVKAATPEAEPTAEQPVAMNLADQPTEAVVELHPPAWSEAPTVRLGEPAPVVEAAAVVVLDEASGAVLHEHNARTPLPPASLTKIATAVVAIEHGELDRLVDIDVDGRDMPWSSLMGLRPGDRFTLHDLLYGLMLPSGNDAALAIGRAVSGSDTAFVEEMNELLARLGLTTSRFANPHGLGAPGHRASALDLALLARYAMSLDEFVELSTATSWTANGNREIEMRNGNGFLGSYEGADGVKVGYTHRAGHTLVASAGRDGNRVYVALLDAPKSAADAGKLLDWAFANHAWPE